MIHINRGYVLLKKNEESVNKNGLIMTDNTNKYLSSGIIVNYNDGESEDFDLSIMKTNNIAYFLKKDVIEISGDMYIIKLKDIIYTEDNNE